MNIILMLLAESGHSRTPVDRTAAIPSSMPRNKRQHNLIESFGTLPH